MLIKSGRDILSSEITPESVYLERRKFLAGSVGLALGAATSAFPNSILAAQGDGLRAQAPADLVRSAPAKWWEAKFDSISVASPSSAFSTAEELTPYRDVISYNNFYEFGVEKGDPAANSGEYKVDPWSVTIEGEVDKPGIYNLRGHP